MKRARWPGEWKVTCQRCGFQYPSSEITREWTGTLVCKKCYEPRHPQTLIKLREETQVPAFVSKDSDVEAHVCYIEAQSCYSGLAQSGCARSGNQQFTFAFLKDLTKNGHGGM